MRVDWPTLLSDLAYLLGEPDSANPNVRIPCGERRLAEYVGVHREAMRRWKEGSKVEYHDGLHLIDAWCRITGKASTFVPTERGTLSAHRAR